MRVTTINRKVLSFITNLTLPATKNLAEISKLSREAIDLFRNPKYEKLFNITRLVEFAIMNFPLDIQSIVLEKLLSYNNSVDNRNTCAVLVLRHILDHPLPNETLDDAIVRAYNAGIPPL